MRTTAILALTTCLALPALAAEEAAPGEALLAERCSVCHTADRPRSKKKTSEEWAGTVNRMRAKGARLTDDEAATLIDYLAKHHGP